MKSTTSLLAASVVAVASAEVPAVGVAENAQTSEGSAGAYPSPLFLNNGPMSATVVPAWGGRLMELRRDGGANALWTDPEAVANGFDSAGKPIWKNVGGEKTWVGSQGPGWRGFAPDGSVWPPPSWFDSAPLSVAHADPTNLLLRSGFHESHGWRVALEREFTLFPDRLVVEERLFPEADGPDGPEAVADDDRRVWSVTQIPFVPAVAVRRVDARRWKINQNCPVPEPRGDGSDWADIDISRCGKNGHIFLDGDALAAPLADGTGRWLQIEQTAAPRHLAHFEKPSRAIMYTTGPESQHSKTPYIELEFVALGADARQTLVMQILDGRP